MKGRSLLSIVKEIKRSKASFLNILRKQIALHPVDVTLNMTSFDLYTQTTVSS